MATDVIIVDGSVGGTNTNVVRVISQSSPTTDSPLSTEANKGYILEHTGTIQIVQLPIGPEVGDIIYLQGSSADLFRITQTADDQILFGDTPTTTGVSGTLESTDANDSLYLTCKQKVGAGGLWVAQSITGNFLIDGTTLNNSINSIPSGLNITSPGNNVAITDNYPNIELDVGKTSSGTNSIAITDNAPGAHGNESASFGHDAGKVNQGTQTIAIGFHAAETNQGQSSIAIGHNCATNNQSNSSIAIGHGCANPNFNGRLAFGSSMEAVTAIGVAAAIQEGYLNLTWNGIHYRLPVFNSSTDEAIGVAVTAVDAAAPTVDDESIINDGVGPELKFKFMRTNTSASNGVTVTDNTTNLTMSCNNPDQTVSLSTLDNNIAISGTYPNFTLEVGDVTAGINAIAITNKAPKVHGDNSTSIGFDTGNVSQGIQTVAIGANAGKSNQGDNAVAIGFSSAEALQGAGAICIGAGAGFSGAPASSISFGTNCSVAGAVGRLAFGSSMEAVTALGSTAAIQSGYLNLEWNDTHYRIPIFNSATTELLTARSYAHLYKSDGIDSPQTIVAGVWEIINAGAYASGEISNFTRSATRLTYTGAETKKFIVTLNFSSTGDVDTEVTMAIYKNGVRDDSSRAFLTSSTGAGFQNLASSMSSDTIVELSTNDYVEPFFMGSLGITIEYRYVGLILSQVS